jgi:hypothetical protein
MGIFSPTFVGNKILAPTLKVKNFFSFFSIPLTSQDLEEFGNQQGSRASQE